MALGTFFADYVKTGIVKRVKEVHEETYLQTHDAVEGTSLELLNDVPWDVANGKRSPASNTRICQIGYHTWNIHRYLININCYNLPAGIVKSTAKLFLYVYAHEQRAGKADVCVVQGMFGDTLTLADYSAVTDPRLGSVVGGIAYYPMDSGYQSIPFNDVGLGWVVSGTVKLGLRVNGDIEAWEPVNGDPAGSGCGANALAVLRTGTSTFKYVKWVLSAVCGGGRSATLNALLDGYDCPYLEVEYSGANSPEYPKHRFAYVIGVEEWDHFTEWQSGIATGDVMSATIPIELGQTYYYNVQTQKVEGGELLYGCFEKDFTCYFSGFVSSLTHRSSPGHYSCEIGLGEIEVETPSYDIELQPTLGGG